MALLSAVSPRSVAVPCALTYPILFAGRAASVNASSIAFCMVSAVGCVTCLPSELQPNPTISAKMVAPLFCACSSSSKIKVQAPSPITRPSLSRSNGLGVSFGESFFMLVANRVSKTAASVTQSSSAPPATISFCLPNFIAS